MKKSLRDEAKAAFKQQYKAAKRSKLDPDQAKGTLQLQKEQAAQQQNGAVAGSEDSGSEQEQEDEEDDEEEEGADDASEDGALTAQRQQGGSGPGAIGQLAIPQGVTVPQF
jgi:hypothetical protein